MRTDNPIHDAEEYANREIPQVGICEHCGEPIRPWEDYYDMDGLYLHDDCMYDYMHKYKHNGI